MRATAGRAEATTTTNCGGMGVNQHMKSSKATLLAVAAYFALVLAQAALAAQSEQIRFNAADQAAAKAATLKRADLAAGWKGGATKVDLTSADKCATKRSNLVLTGAAKSDFKVAAAALSVSSETHVLETAAMVAENWQHTVANAAYMACTRREYIESDDPSIKVVSFKKLAFPKVAQHAVRYRTLTDYATSGGTVRVLIDVILLSQNRTEIALAFGSPYVTRAAVDAAERRLAQTLVSRIAR
jgi:hypothetical protein